MYELAVNNKIDVLNNLYKNMPVNTKNTYLKAIDQFFNFCNTGVNNIHTISVKEIQEYINYLKNELKYKNSTINIKLSALKSFFNKASLLLDFVNPFCILRDMSIKTNQKVDISFSKDQALQGYEVKRLLDYYNNRAITENEKNSYTSKRNYLLISLLYFHGLRISEALNIKVEDITKYNNSYCINIIGKGNKPRKIKINNDLYEKIIMLHDEGFIFRTLEGKQLSRISIAKDIKRVAKKVLNKDIHLHTFRHSFATNMINITKDISKVSKYLGHSSINTTSKIYDHNELELSELALLNI